ncbi:AraC family transcriptional regulator ligand-binding domain-containing protein [Ruegeria sp. EL01]|uniref:AraC family transcriptional regulator ligand-binding domain-containing protein n=1 Tax=Ruegeria sp. EL01 TaxID=2107578 RepID=UPI000EA80A68|nr:AraC family transcriptional regulator ligand-binding domain-containing protein [Ruegeria sp. EL01]
MTRLDPQDRVPNHWLLSIFRVPHLAPHARGALAATNLPPDTLDEIGTEIPRGVEAQILDYLAGHLNTPYYGAEIGVSLDPRNTSLLTYILFNSTTLREALYHVKHFAPVTRPRAIVEIRETPTHVDFVVDGLGPNLMLDTHFVEFTLGAPSLHSDLKLPLKP